MPKKSPLKPERTITSIIFPADGPPYHNVEHFPGEQDKQELIAVKKLLGAIAHSRGEHYRNPRSGSDTTDDIICESEDGRNIEIQVAGPRDQNMLLVQKMRKSYKESIETEHHNILGKFRGCYIVIFIPSISNYLPKIDSKAGQRCLRELVSGLVDFSSDIDTLEIGKSRSRRLLIGAKKKEVDISCMRFAAADDLVPFSYQWTEAYQGSPNDRVILSETVQKKIKKYAEPKNEFWLLIYTTDIPIVDNDPDIKRAREILDKHKHPFDIVWYLHPQSNMDNGHLIKVWPPD